MIDTISDYIANLYVSKKIINAKDIEVYKYGITLILNDVITFTIIMTIATFVGRFRFGSEFLITFCTTRVYCGGYHAKEEYVCRTTMLSTFFAILFISNAIKSCSISTIIIIIMISFTLLLPLIPVKHPNKVLTEKQMKINKKKGILIYTFYSLLSLILCIFKCYSDAIIIALSLSAVTLLAIIGTYTNERSEN